MPYHELCVQCVARRDHQSQPELFKADTNQEIVALIIKLHLAIAEE